MEIFSPYGHAIASLALWSVVMIVLSGLSTRGRVAENRCECGKPKRDYANSAYRADRAFMNAIETTGPFIAATVAAILSGAAPFWVNLFATVFIVTRIIMAYVHIGTTNQPLRSAFWSAGILCILGLVIMTVMALF